MLLTAAVYRLASFTAGEYGRYTPGTSRSGTTCTYKKKCVDYQNLIITR